MRVSSLCWGIVLVGIGLFFLAINTGYLDHYVWIKLISLWPVLLIAIGIALIFNRSRFKLLALLAPFLLALTFVYVAVSEWRSDGYYGYNSKYTTRYSSEMFEYQIDADPEVERLNVEIDFGLGEMRVGSTSAGLFSGDFEYHTRKPDISYHVSRGEGKLRVKSRDLQRLNFFKRRNITNDSRIFIADYLPLELYLDIGAAAVDLDLADHQLKKLSLDTGAAEIDLRLGCKSENVKVDIDTGASSIIIRLPSEMAVEIDSDIALSKTNFRSAGLEKYHGRYRSDNFNSASCTVSINIDSGVSKIKLYFY